MKALIVLTGICALCLLGACATESSGTTMAVKTPAPSAAPSPTPSTTTTSAATGKPIIVEAEEMKLSGCDIVADAKASNGKAVFVKYDSSVGTYELTLDAGTYVATLYENAPDGSHDALYIGLVGSSPTRVFPTEWGKWVAAKSFEISMDKPGTVTLKFSPSWQGQKAGEYGMLIDRFEIVKK